MPNEEKREITLYEIIKMNQISESNYDLMKDYNIEIKQNNEECDDFFNKKKYILYYFFSHRLKGKYFEYSVQAE